MSSGQGRSSSGPYSQKRLSWSRPLVAMSFLPVVPTLVSLGWGGESQALNNKDVSQTRILAGAESLLSVLPTCSDIAQWKRTVSREVGKECASSQHSYSAEVPN